MAILIFTHNNVGLSSRWKVSSNSSGIYYTQAPTLDQRTVSFEVAGLPAAATINSAYISFTFNTAPNTGVNILRYRIDTDTYTDLSCPGTTQVPITISGNGTVSGTLQFKANGTLVPPANVGGGSQGAYWNGSGAVSATNITLTIDYNAYSVPTPPTNLSVSPNNVAPGASATLSWSGAASGTNNAITGYEIYRSTNLAEGYILLTSVASTATSGSTSITAPSVDGESYYYRIITLGTINDYMRSAFSQSFATLTCGYSAVSAPTTVSPLSTIVKIEDTSTITYTWSGAAAGTNNSIIGYEIYRRRGEAGSFELAYEISSSSSSGSCQISTPDTHGVTYYYTMCTLGSANGARSNFSNITVIKSYSPPSTPIKCQLSSTLSHENVMLSWSNSLDGVENPITGYEIQRRESSDGQTWGAWTTLVSSQTSTILSVAPSSTYGNYYSYRVRALGSVYNSNWIECCHTLRRDHKPIPDFTDLVLTATVTNVKAIHMTELQNAISMLLEFYFLDAQTMTSIIAGETQLAGWTSHVNEIRAAIDFLTTYHDEWLEIPANCPRVDVIQQLRDVVLDVEKPACVLGVGKLGAIVTK